MIPEAAIAMLACARIGAVHSVIFGGFSAESVRDRVNDAEARVLITADGGYRRGQVVPLKRMADQAMAESPTIEHCIVVRRRTGSEGDEAFAAMQEGRDHWWHRLLDGSSSESEPEPMDAEDLLFILYTSGTTGKPKGIVHTTGGYLTQVAATTRYVFDLKPSDVFWCTADVGWVTGHSYVVYGPLAEGATVLMYEGAPDWPERDRFWELVERYGVTILYTAPTAIRAFMKWGTQHPARHDLSTLRLLGSVGEPINPEAWIWYQTHIGGGRCPIVDTWWQTETGGIMITPLPGVTTTKPGSATTAFPGIAPELVDNTGAVLPAGGGFLTLAAPWPGMLRTIYGDDERYRSTYWSRFPGRYFAGDGAKLDDDGYWWILGRVDDVLNVAGHRIGTMEVESALVAHPAVAEAAVVGRAHELKGQALAAFVTLKDGNQASPELKDDLKAHVTEKIGAIARPDDIFFSADLPKTRSGKIMRRLLKDIAEGRALGDTTTLADPNVVSKLKEMYEGQES
jgi:acetyl-CoA synthetase